MKKIVSVYMVEHIGRGNRPSVRIKIKAKVVRTVPTDDAKIEALSLAMHGGMKAEVALYLAIRSRLKAEVLEKIFCLAQLLAGAPNKVEETVQVLPPRRRWRAKNRGDPEQANG